MVQQLKLQGHDMYEEVRRAWLPGGGWRVWDFNQDWWCSDGLHLEEARTVQGKHLLV